MSTDSDLGDGGTTAGRRMPSTTMDRSRPTTYASLRPPCRATATGPGLWPGSQKFVTARDIAAMLEVPLLDALASPVDVARAAALAEATGVATLLCHGRLVRTAAEALEGVSTCVGAPIGLDCADAPVPTPNAAAEEAQHLVREGATMIVLVWHGTQPATMLHSAIRATLKAIYPTGGTVRVALDTTAMTPGQIAVTTRGAINAGATCVGAGASCTGRARLIDALRVKRAAAGHTVAWAAELRDLDEVLLARAEGIDFVRGPADLIIREALRREYDGKIRLPRPGQDYISWAGQLSAHKTA